MDSEKAILDLNKLPNIGKVLAERLFFSGIKSSKHLKEIGTKAAFIKLLAFDETACINQLYAIEGAIQNIRWHDLNKPEKDGLLDFFHSLK